MMQQNTAKASCYTDHAQNLCTFNAIKNILGNVIRIASILRILDAADLENKCGHVKGQLPAEMFL